MADAPKIFEIDPETLISEIKADWEAGVGKNILPAQPEYQQVLSLANRETLMRGLGDYTVKQNLTEFSTAPILDFKARNWGLTRLAAQPALVSMRFNLQTGHGGVLIPEGTRVTSTDGQITVATDYEQYAAPGTVFVEVDATATVVGSQGNNQPIGALSVIVDAVPFVMSATNTAVTEGGSEEETDEQLRARIVLAPSQFSTAGTVSAYKFHTRSVNPRIIDVQVLNGGAGVVNVYPLVEGGIETPEAILNAVSAKLNEEDIRPINDYINVISPERIEYVLAVTLWLKWGTVQSVASEAAKNALEVYTAAQANHLGEDITLAQLTTAVMKDNLDKIMDVSFGAFTGLQVPPTSFAVCTSVSVVQVYYEDPNE